MKETYDSYCFLIYDPDSEGLQTPINAKRLKIYYPKKRNEKTFV